MSPRGQLSLGGFTEIVAEGFKVTTTRAVSAAARFHRGLRWLLQQVPRSLGPGWFYCWHTGGGKIRASVGVATHPLPARTTPSEARRGGWPRHSSRLLFAVRLSVGFYFVARRKNETSLRPGKPGIPSSPECQAGGNRTGCSSRGLGHDDDDLPLQRLLQVSPRSGLSWAPRGGWPGLRACGEG